MAPFNGLAEDKGFRRWRQEREAGLSEPTLFVTRRIFVGFIMNVPKRSVCDMVGSNHATGQRDGQVLGGIRMRVDDGRLHRLRGDIPFTLIGGLYSNKSTTGKRPHL